MLGWEGRVTLQLRVRRCVLGWAGRVGREWASGVNVGVGRQSNTSVSVSKFVSGWAGRVGRECRVTHRFWASKCVLKPARKLGRLLEQAAGKRWGEKSSLLAREGALHDEVVERVHVGMAESAHAPTHIAFPRPFLPSPPCPHTPSASGSPPAAPACTAARASTAPHAASATGTPFCPARNSAPASRVACHPCAAACAPQTGVGAARLPRRTPDQAGGNCRAGRAGRRAVA
eukprot:365580-Chlamydomonas_euryale.AAC.8